MIDNENIFTVHIIALFVIVFFYIIELIIIHKLKNKHGLMIYKKEYKYTRDILQNIVGNKINKDDVFIKVIDTKYCTFESRATVPHHWFNPFIYGYLEVKEDNVITVYKKPFCLLLLVLWFLIFLVEGYINKVFIPVLIFLLILGGAALLLNISKIKSIKLDLELFINIGK